MKFIAIAMSSLAGLAAAIPATAAPAATCTEGTVYCGYYLRDILGFTNADLDRAIAATGATPNDVNRDGLFECLAGNTLFFEHQCNGQDGNPATGSCDPPNDGGSTFHCRYGPN